MPSRHRVLIRASVFGDAGRRPQSVAATDATGASVCRQPEPSLRAQFHQPPPPRASRQMPYDLGGVDLPNRGIRSSTWLWHARSMTTEQLTQFSESLADSVSTAAPSVVQIHGAGRPASGLVFTPDIVITTARALGREDGLQVRGHDGSTHRSSTGWLGSDDEPCAVACGRTCRRAHHARNYTTARRPSRARGRTIVEQRSQRQCGHRCGHRRSAAHRPEARD